MGDQPKEAGRIPVAEVVRSADLVSYQEGSVVSVPLNLNSPPADAGVGIQPKAWRADQRPSC